MSNTQIKSNLKQITKKKLKHFSTQIASLLDICDGFGVVEFIGALVVAVVVTVFVAMVWLSCGFFFVSWFLIMGLYR